MHTRDTAEGEKLKQIYNLIDWIDFGLIGAIILYYGRLIHRLQYELPAIFEGGYERIILLSIEHASYVSIALLMASLAVCTIFICLTIKMRARRDIGAARAVGRIIWNGIWIPLEAYLLFMILFS